MTKTNTIIILFIILITGCQLQSEVHRQLVNADSLLYNNCVDSASTLLDDIKLQTQDDSAYFFVLKAETDYRQRYLPNFDEINYSIKYYEKHHNNRHLSNSYYYKACAFLIRDTLPSECVVLLKKAEQTSENTSDNSLKDKIYSALAYINSETNNPEEALKYAKKEYKTALLLNTRRDIAYAMLRLSTCYKTVGQKDSSEYYIMLCKSFANDVDDNDKSYIYNMLGECFIPDNPDAALQYFNTALKYKKLSTTYHHLAKVYYLKNDTLNWQKYSDSALSNAWFDTKIDILTDIARTHYDAKDITAYKKTTDSIVNTWKKFMDYKKDNLSLEIQRKYDFEKQKIEYTRNIVICIAIITTLIAMCIILYQKRRHEKQKALQKELEFENHNLQLLNKLCESQNIIDEYEQNLRYLNDLLDQSDSEEYNASKKQIADVIEKGKAIYQKIEQNSCIAADREYWIFCTFYFQNTFAKKAIKIFRNYRELTTDEKMFVITDDYFGKTDTEIATILDISQTTVRTRRTKLKTKLS